ncbi:UNKNOWN [Stylonychia lemnae]|uniref:Uncharacterized protein n=1 Tax=Stylonychia lemnae TaxID=5949 RepID=A0A078BE94_STYLE|nr:UNKNOWN [Stylonychia lemnae]|eukprot:CDW91447.1 UNKNOWN [Stylonychia lemnae]
MSNWYFHINFILEIKPPLQEQFLRQGDILQRLSQGLLNFKAPLQGEASNRKKVEDTANPLKWGGVLPLSPLLCKTLVLRFSSSLNLDELLSFDLLDSYFLTNDQSKKQFSYINQVEQNINSLSQELQRTQQQNQNNLQLYQQTTMTFNKMIEKWSQEFQTTTAQILDDSMQVYFEERKSLFDSVSIVLEFKMRYPQTKVVETFTQQDLPENLIKSLEQNAKSFNVWTKFKDQKDIAIKLQREEIQILQCHLQYYKNHQQPTAVQIQRLMKYLISKDFTGLIYKEKSFAFQYIQDQDLIQQRIIIQSLSLLNGVNLLQPSLFVELELNNRENMKRFVTQLLSQADQFRAVAEMFQSMEINEITACIYIVFRQIINLLKLEKIQRDLGLTPDKIQLVVNTQVDRSIEEAYDDSVSSTSSAFIEKNWLNMVYPYLVERNMRQSLMQAQQLAFEIFKDPIQLERIWGLIERTNNLIGKDVMVGPARKTRYHSLDIFEEIMQDPIEKLGDFCLIMSNLCGNKYHKYEQKVINLLKKYNTTHLEDRARQRYGNKSLLQILLTIFESRTTVVQDLSTENYNSYLNLCYLIGKIVSQNSVEYETLNDEFLAVELVGKQAGIKGLRGKQDLNNYQISEPILATIIEAIQKLSSQPFEESTYSLRMLVKAVSKIYKHLNLESEILMHFQFYEIQSDLGFHFIHFYKTQLDDFEFQIGHLQDYRRMEIGGSILVKLIANVYYPLVLNFFQLNFADVKYLVNMTYRLLKLTKTLLDKYRDINPHYKLPISHRLPQYDQLLIYLNEVFNLTHIENIIQQVLLLSEDELEGKSTNIQNKYWIEVLRKGPVSAKHQKQFQKLISISLQCYNTLLELTYINNQTMNLPEDRQEQVGARIYSLINLNLVKSLQSLMSSPGQGATYQVERKNNSHLSYSIFNIIQYYVRPGSLLSKSISQINIQATKFMLNCCNIWATPSNRVPVNLQSLLKYTGIIQQEIKQQYILNFIEASKNISSPLQMHYLVVFLDLMIVSASSQTTFVDDLFREDIFKKRFIDLVGNILPNSKPNEITELLQKDIMSKVIILLAELSNNRICQDVLKEIIDQDHLKKIFQLVIHNRFVPDIQKKIDFNYNSSLFGDPFRKLFVDKHNKQYIKENYSACLALITIKYYFRLLQDEYSRDLNNQYVRDAITNLFSHPTLLQELKNFSVKVDELYHEINQANIIMNEGVNLRDERSAKHYELLTIQSQLITQQHQIFMETSRIKSEDTTVKILDLECSQIIAYVKSHTNLNYLMQQNVFEANQYARIGPQIVINTDELIEVMRTYYYTDEEFLDGMRVVTSKYNMMISYLMCFNQLTDTVKSFILSVGKTRTRQNLRNKDFIIKDRVINTSLFVFVDNNDPKDLVNNDNAVKGLQNRLANKMIMISENLITSGSFTKIQAQTRFNEEMSNSIIYPRLSLEIRQLETDIDYLTIVLGVINNLSTIGKLSSDNTNLLKSMAKFKQVLLQIRKNQIVNIGLYDGGQAQKTEYELQCARQYINLVLQVFSIENLFRASQSVIIQSSEQDMEYIYISSSVLEIINEKQCFIPGLQILTLALNLISNDKLISFFKRTQNNPLNIVISRFNNAATSLLECTKIVEFFMNLIKVDQGAELINDSNIILNSSIGSFVSRLKNQSLYVSENVDQKRNPLHVLWCFILLFIRSLNQKLIKDNNYKRTISAQLRLFEGRIPAIFDVGSIIINKLGDNQFIKNTLSLALFEELELISACFEQIMENVEILDQNDFKIFEQIKDRYFFSVVHLFTVQFKVKQVSATEQYFNGIYLGKIKENMAPGSLIGSSSQLGDKINFSGFDLLVHTQMIKTFLNMNSAMLNVLLYDQKLQDERSFINTWDRKSLGAQSNYQATPRKGGDFDNFSISHSNKSQYPYSYLGIHGDRDLEQFQGLNYLFSSLQNYNSALREMNKLFRMFVSNEQALKEFHQNMFAYYNHDEWINNEMMGLNQYQGSHTFQDILQQFECSMQSGYMVSTLLLQKLEEMQYEGEANYGGQVTIPLKSVIDSGTDIKRLYVDFIGTAKLSKMAQLTMDNFGGMISDVVEKISQSPQLEHNLY